VVKRAPATAFFLFVKIVAMKIQVITLFPEVVEPYLKASMMWKAGKNGSADFEIINLRDFGLGPRRQVDDTHMAAATGCY
jgi:tRNA (guanine37-N1)-methyltransferase